MEKAIIASTFIFFLVGCNYYVQKGEFPTSTEKPPTGEGGEKTPSETEIPERVTYSYVAQHVFKNCCFECHQGSNSGERVDLTSYAAIMNAEVVIADDPDESLLYYYLITEDEDARMPPAPRNRLTERELEIVHRWIKGGALEK